MSDLVERLKSGIFDGPNMRKTISLVVIHESMQEAAAEIERLRSLLEAASFYVHHRRTLEENPVCHSDCFRCKIDKVLKGESADV